MFCYLIQAFQDAQKCHWAFLELHNFSHKNVTTYLSYMAFLASMNQTTEQHISHRSDGTTTRTVITLKITHRGDFLVCSDQLQHVFWLCPLESVTGNGARVYGDDLFPVMCFLFFLSKQCQCPMEIINESVFAWQPETLYYKHFIKSLLPTDILTQFFYGIWGTCWGRKTATLRWLSYWELSWVKCIVMCLSQTYFKTYLSITDDIFSHLKVKSKPIYKSVYVSLCRTFNSSDFPSIKIPDASLSLLGVGLINYIT